MKQRDPELGKGWVQFVHTLFVDTMGGQQKMLCANTEGPALSSPFPAPRPNRSSAGSPASVILTAEISQATFGLTPTQYTEFKRLKRENLLDHMTDLELIFSMLGEAATTEITRTRNTQGFPENQEAAHDGGTVAGNARRELEQKSGRKVVTSGNYLTLTQSEKRKQVKSKTGKC